MTPLRIVLGLNGIVLLLVYVSTGVFNYWGQARTVALTAPFLISAMNLCLGVLSLILMGLLKIAKSDGAALADKYMQTFMISFGVGFAYGIPACMFGINLK
ncbi:hypothetical protein [Asticcacaulis solisilvae]|uniref:hypothetical protein n=1 Tax=Asticcacaulis solisilvae TaxID=1217274 RepID=UPI003FD8F39C